MGADELKTTNGQDATPVSDPELYGYSFWSAATAAERRGLLRSLCLPIFYNILLMWGCLSLFWGSLTTNNELGKIKAVLVNMEDGSGVVGGSIVNAISRAKGSLDWQIYQGDTTTTAQEWVVDEGAWAAVAVSANATSALQQALATGDPTYSPQNAVVLYYTSARNQITVNSHVVPGVLAILNPTLAALSLQNTRSFLQNNTSNMTALQTALKCPQCLTSPFVLRTADLIPFDSAVASGSTMVGLIFLLTFTFSVFQIVRINALGLGAKLRLTSALIFRTIVSLTVYFILGLMYTLINRAFNVPMSGHFSEAAGFVVYWMLNWCTMAAVGLPMESLFTLIGLQWAPYFLSFWIVANVSGAFSSFNIMPSFYKYGYFIPFYHSIQGARTIIFGTKNHLGANFGVLIAWSVFSLAGVYVFTALRMRENKRKGRHEIL